MSVAVARIREKCVLLLCATQKKKRNCPTMARAIEEKRQSQCWAEIVRRDRLTDFEQSRSWSEQALAGVHCHGAARVEALCTTSHTLINYNVSSLLFNYPQRHYGQDNHSAIHFAPASLLVRINTTKSAMGKRKGCQVASKRWTSDQQNNNRVWRKRKSILMRQSINGRLSASFCL